MSPLHMHHAVAENSGYKIKGVVHDSPVWIWTSARRIFVHFWIDLDSRRMEVVERRCSEYSLSKTTRQQRTLLALANGISAIHQ